MPLDEETKALIRREVEQEIASAGRDIRRIGANALKTVASIASVIVLLLGLIGFSSCTDAVSGFTRLVERRIDALVAESDSGSSVSANLTTMVNRALVMSSLAAHAYEPELPLTLTDGQRNRLVSWLSSDTIAIKDFINTLELFNLLTPEQKNVLANESISDLLNPSGDSENAWIRKRPHYRAAILAAFDAPDLAPAAADVAELDAVPVHVRVAAVRYVRRMRSTEAATRILHRIDTSTDLGREALITCALVLPKSKEAIAGINRLAQSPLGTRQIAIIEDLVREAWEDYSRPTTSGHGGRDLDGLDALMASVIKTVMKSGGTIIARNMVEEHVNNAARVYGIKWPGVTSEKSEVFLGGRADLLRFVPYWRCVKDAVENRDVTLLSRLLPQATSSRRAHASMAAARLLIHVEDPRPDLAAGGDEVVAVVRTVDNRVLRVGLRNEHNPAIEMRRDAIEARDHVWISLESGEKDLQGELLGFEGKTDRLGYDFDDASTDADDA